MNRRTRMIVTVLASLLLTLAGAAIAEAPAYAAATCYENSCAGYDPQTRYPGCLADATYWPSTASYGGITVVEGRNYYSDICKANWAWGQLTSGAVSRGYKLQVQISNGHGQSMCTPGDSSDAGHWVENCSGLYGGPYALYTDMVNGIYLTYATISVWDSSGTTVLARVKINR